MGDDNVLIGRNHWDVPVARRIAGLFASVGGWITSCGGWFFAGGTRPRPTCATAIEPLQVYNNEP